MAKNIFVNLPVKDLARSVAFFKTLGYSFNPQFTDENATCMVVSENIFVMLLVEKFFQTFTPRPIADATKSTEVLVCLSADSKAEVRRIVETAITAGGHPVREADDKGFMFGWAFADLDGHIWEYVWMDPSAVGG